MKSSKYLNPQEERDQWRQRQQSSTSIPGSGRDDLVIDRGNEFQVFEGETARLQKENNILREALNRSQKELRAYQIKFPTAYAPCVDDEEPPIWMVVPEELSALFEAYDARIRELDAATSKQSAEFDLLRDKVGEMAAENDRLRAASLEHIRRSQTVVEADPMQEQEIRNLKDQLSVLMAENIMLMEQKSLLEGGLEACQNDLHKRTMDLEKSIAACRDLGEQLEAYQLQCRDLESQRDEAAKAAVGFSTALSKAEAELELLRDSLKVSQVKVKETETSLTELQSKWKRYQDQVDQDNLETMRRMKKAEDRVRELHTLLLQKTQEADSIQEALRKLKREYVSTRQDAEGMLQVMGGQERQIAEYAARDAELVRLTRECKEKVEEALSARDQAIVREEQGRRDIERLQEERKRAALKRQSEIESAVELARHRSNEQISTCDRELKELAERNAALRVDMERLSRDSKSARDSVEKLQRLLESERRAFDLAVKEIGEKLKAAVIAREEETGRRQEVQDQNKEFRSSIDKLRGQVDAIKAQAAQLENAKDVEINTLKASIRDMQREAVERNRQLSKLQKEAEETRDHLQQQVNAAERKHVDESILYRRRAQEADRMAKELEQAALHGGQRNHQLFEQVQEKTTAALQQAQAQINHESSVVKTLSQRNRELDHIVREMSAEKTVLARVVDDARNTIDQLKFELSQTRSSVSHLTGQLSQSFASREESAEIAARAMENVHSRQAWSPPGSPSTGHGTASNLFGDD